MDFRDLSRHKSIAQRLFTAAVPFLQHTLETSNLGLWEGVFFIACLFASAKVNAATEGGIPKSSRLEASVRLGFWVVAGRLGDLPGVQLHPPETEPSH